MAGDNGKGNGDARAPTRLDGAPWEGIRSLVWHYSLTHALSRSGSYLRRDEGFDYITGYSYENLITSIDLGRMLRKLGQEIGHQRAERFAQFVDGRPQDHFSRIERMQLKQDVKRLAQIAIEGGYGGLIHGA